MYRYTGQRQEESLGLYFYNARWYDPSLGRFAQADTIVPSPGNPQSLNRYTYTFNNPLKYVDPTGHEPCPDGNCGPIWLRGYTENELLTYHQYQGASTNDCAPTSMAMAVNLALGLQWQPVKKDAMGTAMQNASKGFGNQGYRLTGSAALILGKDAEGATPPWGAEKALNEFARELSEAGYPKSFRAEYKNHGVLDNLTSNLKKGYPTIVFIVWPNDTRAHTMVVAGYNQETHIWSFLDPLNQNAKFTQWSTTEFLQNWNRPFAGNGNRFFQNAMVTLYPGTSPWVAPPTRKRYEPE
jgi:RHS repeat-associated protein